MISYIVKDENGNDVDFEVAVNLMDDDLRESLHSEGIETEQEFFDEYCKRHEEKYGEKFVVG